MHSWRGSTGNGAREGGGKGAMVGWAQGGALSAATEQTPTALLVSLRIVEEHGACRPEQQSLICYASSPSCCQMSYMQLLATEPTLKLCEAGTPAPICSHMNAKLENAPRE